MEAEARTVYNEESDTVEEPETIFPLPKNIKRKEMPPPPPVDRPVASGRREFQSSIDLVSIHEDKTIPSSYTFDYDVNSFYEKDEDSPDLTEDAREEKIKREVHPLIKELKGDTGREELKKGLIYGKIMQRKY